MKSNLLVLSLAAGSWSCDAPPRDTPSNPLTTASTPDRAEQAFAGVVGRRLRAGGYSYVRVDDRDAQRWVATMGDAPSVDTRVEVQAYAAADDFHSRRLQRDFSRLLFGSVHPVDQSQTESSPR